MASEATRQILFTDDDHEMRQALGTYLSWYGFRVDYAETFDQALAKLQKNHYDLLICEAMMPGTRRWKNGFEFSKGVRLEENQGSAVKILLVGCEELEPEEYQRLKETDVFYMNKYKSMQVWLEKMEAILQIPPRSLADARRP